MKLKESNEFDNNTEVQKIVHRVPVKLYGELTDRCFKSWIFKDILPLAAPFEI